jgi:hypothetical protein
MQYTMKATGSTRMKFNNKKNNNKKSWKFQVKRKSIISRSIDLSKFFFPCFALHLCQLNADYLKGLLVNRTTSTTKTTMVKTKMLLMWKKIFFFETLYQQWWWRMKWLETVSRIERSSGKVRENWVEDVAVHKALFWDINGLLVVNLYSSTQKWIMTSVYLSQVQHKLHQSISKMVYPNSLNLNHLLPIFIYLFCFHLNFQKTY